MTLITLGCDAMCGRLPAKPETAKPIPGRGGGQSLSTINSEEPIGIYLLTYRDMTIYLADERIA